MSSFSKTASLAVVALGAQQVLAHIQLATPFGINSKFDPQTPESDKDYSGTTPLDPSGGNYPCKGYNTPEKIASLNSVATLVSGQSFHVELSGSATHEGGSCQFSISYDGGKTFAVMHSVMGGCPLDLAYDFPVPALPAKKKAIFAWTWNNKVGNREEYMDCAVVDVQGSAASASLPGVFRANTLGSECVVPEGTEVVYPNPGKSVSGPLAGGAPTTLNPCSFNQETTVTVSGDGSTSGPSGGNGGGSGGGQGAGTGNGGPQPGQGGGSSSSSVATTKTPDAPQPQPTATTSATVPDTTGSTGDGSTGGGSTGGGSGAGSGAGSFIQCTGQDTWSLCNSVTGECTPMGAVAPGTYCDDKSASMLAIGNKRRMARRVRRAGHRALKGRTHG